MPLPLLTLAFTVILWNNSFAQDCNNPLLKLFNFTRLTAPQAGASYPYCTNLKNGLACCSNTTVAGFQTLANNLISNIQSIAGKRDSYMNQLNDQFTQQYQAANLILQQYSSQVADIIDSHPEIGYPLQNQLYLFQIYSNELLRLDGTFTSALQKYQRARVVCFSALVELQASMWCLACDATYSAQGVHPDGSINISSTVCDTIQNSCAPFTVQGDLFNALYQAQQSYNRVRNLAQYLALYKANGNVLPDYVIHDDIYKPQNNIQKTVDTPPGCNANNCSWQCQNLFSPEFIMNQTLVGSGGGIIGGSDVILQAIGLGASAYYGTDSADQPAASNNEVSEYVITYEENVEEAVVLNISTTPDGESIIENNFAEENSEIHEIEAENSHTGVPIDPANIDDILIAAIESTNEAIAMLTNQTDGLSQSSQSTLILVVTTGYWTPSITTSGVAINIAPDPAGITKLGTNGGATAGVIVDSSGSQNEEVIEPLTGEAGETIFDPNWQ